MLSRSWELKVEESFIGTLSLSDIDQPWYRCEFSPGGTWNRVEHLFREQASAVDSGDQERMMSAIRAVRELQLRLYPEGGGEVITPVMVQIRGKKASFRT